MEPHEGEQREGLDELAVARLHRQAELNLERLQQRIEAGEIDPEPMSVEEIIALGRPITRADLRNRVVSLSQFDLTRLRGVAFVSTFTGDVEDIDAASARRFKPHHRFILHPEDVGE